MVKVGDKVRFVPGGVTDDSHERCHKAVTGTVEWVNEAHRTYGIFAYLGDGERRRPYRESFKF